MHFNDRLQVKISKNIRSTAQFHLYFPDTTFYNRMYFSSFTVICAQASYSKDNGFVIMFPKMEFLIHFKMSPVVDNKVLSMQLEITHKYKTP